jgi:Protein of unknown function (DUF2695)
MSEILFPVERDYEWIAFCQTLGWLLRGDTPGDLPGRCDHTTRFARQLLEMRGYNADESLAFYAKTGGYCDCEILLNTDHFAAKDAR